MITIAWLLIIASIIFFVSLPVPPYRAVLIADRFTGSQRSVGPGWHFIWPWEYVPEELTSLKANTRTLEADFETSDESSISLRISYLEAPYSDHLPEYQSFSSDQERLNGINERLKAIFSLEIRKMKKRDQVMDSLELLAKTAEDIFEQSCSENGKLLEHFFGTNISGLVISDPALPQVLKDAQIEREATEKRNESRKLEMTNLKKMASDLVAEAGRHNQKLSYEIALRKVQIQFEKKGVQENFNTLGIEQGTQELIASALKEVLHGKHRKQN